MARIPDEAVASVLLDDLDSTESTHAAVTRALAVERERVVRLFLDLAEDFVAAARMIHASRHPGVRDAARAGAYEDAAQEMRTLALELGVTA